MKRSLSLALVALLVVVFAACEPPPTTTTTTVTTASSTTTAAPTTTTTGLPPSSGKPNVAILITDDQPCDQHQTYLCDTIYANMHFLAGQPGGHWYTSTQTRYHTSLCCPGRATILTGQTSVHNGQFGNSDAPQWEGETLATAMQRNGYQTGLFGKYLNPYNGNGDDPPGWDRWLAHISLPSFYNFDVADGGDQTSTNYTVPKTDNSSYDAYWFVDRLNGWVNQQHDAGQPWFAYFAPYGPHAPSGYTSDVVNADITPTVSQLPNWKEGCAGANDPDISDKPSVVQADAGCTGTRNWGRKSMASVDKAFRKLYDNLAATGQLDNTIIVVLGDNGMAVGSHGDNGKQCAYEECHTNPLMVRVPSMPGGTVGRLVSNVDVLPTLLDMTGGSTTLAVDGRSAVPLLTGDTSGWRTDAWQHHGDPHTPVPGDYDTLRQDCVVHTPCYSYTEYHDGEIEMYDLTADPYQLVNLLPNPTTGYAGQPGWDASNPTVTAVRDALHAHEATGT